MAPVTAVNAEYKTLASFNNVYFYFPSPENDKYVKKIDQHQISLPDGKTISVPEHFRRGYLVNGQIVTANIFLDKQYQGTKVLVKITVVMKSDHHREKNNLILDIGQASAENKSADYILKIGVTDDGTSNNKFAVPGTGKYIQFLKIRNS